ncbi:MAG: phosphotransferase family protein [Nitrospinaceae bacterium]
MLSPENDFLVKQDPRVPALALILDPQAFCAALKPHLAVESAQLTYIRYQPGRRCLATYHLQAQGTSFDVHATAFANYERLGRVKAGEGESIPGFLGAGRIIFDDPCVVVWTFPNDRQLKSLALLCDARGRKRLLEQVFTSMPNFWEGEVEPLAYKPERRYVARVKTPSGSRAVLKFYQPSIFPKMRIHAEAFSSMEHFRFPLCLGASEAHGVLGFEWLPGRMLREILPEDLDRAVDLVRQAGAGLQELHRQEVSGLTYRKREGITETLLEQGKRLGVLCPPLARQTGNLSVRFAARLMAEPPIQRPIHGDFYAKQIRVGNGRLGLLDFDDAALGDPRNDLGRFIAQMEHDVLTGSMPASHLVPLTEALLEGYRKGTRQSIPNGLQTFIAMELFHLAHFPFRRCEPDWANRIKMILERVEALCDNFPNGRSLGAAAPSTVAAERAHPLAVEDSYRVSKDLKMPFLRRALDPCEVEKRMAFCLSGEHHPTEEFHLKAIRVVDYQPEQRCLMEYDFVQESPGLPAKRISLLGKVRARGLDNRTYHLQRCLWNNGFGEDNSDRISVPEPVGRIPEFHMWIYRKAPGIPATHLLAAPDGIRLARQIARAAHKLHGMDILPRPRHTIQDELKILHERLPRVAQMHPQWKPRLDRILKNCDRLGAEIPEGVQTGIHRNFYPDQVLVDGERLYVLDLDLYCEGDPGLDIGNFLGHLMEQGLRTLGDPKALMDRGQAMVEEFLRLAGSAHRTSVEIYTTLTLVRHIYLSTQFPDRQPFTESLMELCEQRLTISIPS